MIDPEKQKKPLFLRKLNLLDTTCLALFRNLTFLYWKKSQKNDKGY